MSTVIDERIVEMKFNNSDFEKHAQESMSTLDKLKQSLKLESAGKSLDELSRSATSFNLDGVGNAVSTVQDKFSALSTIAVGALLRIGDQAVQTGERMLKSLTVDPIATGFQEYEQNMDSVQTIMAGTGESLDVVQGKLDELNHYADRTIYSFADMTSNIGKFTNAGVKLNDAVAAIQGIANEAAVSGANAQQASHAMYNFAQALSSGYVKLIDWKSIENANMATVEFKQQLIDTAVAMGTLVKEGDKYKTTTTNAQGKVSDLFNATLGFNDALQNQWMTSEVLTATLAKYADETTDIGKKAFAAAQDIKTFTQMYDTLKEAAQSGWSESFRMIVGDFEEGKSLWTAVGQEIGGIIDKMSDERNALLKEWKEGGGRDAMIEAFKNIWNGLKSVITPIKEAFSNIFPKVTSQQLIDFSKKLAEVTKKLTLSKDTSAKLKVTFSGLFTVIKKLGTGVKNIVTSFSPLISKIGEVGSALLDFTSKIGLAIVNGKKFKDVGGIFSETFDSMKFGESVLNSIQNGIQSFAEKTKNTFDAWGGGVKGAIAVVLSELNEVSHKMINFVEDVTGLDLSSFKKSVENGILIALHDTTKSIDTVKKNIQTFKDNIVKSFNEGGGGIKGAFNVSLDIVGDLGEKLLNFIEELTGWDISGVTEKFTNAIDTIKDKINEFSITKKLDDLKSNLNDTDTVVGTIKKNVILALDAIGQAFNGLVQGLGENPFLGFTAIFAIFKGKSILDIINNVKDISENIGDFVEKLKSAGDNAKKGLGGVSDALSNFTSTLNPGSILKIAVSIGILAGSLYALSSITMDANFAANVGALTVMLGEVVGAMEVLGKTLSGKETLKLNMISSELIKVSGAILILSFAVQNFNSVNPETVGETILLMLDSLVMVIAAMKAIQVLDVNKIGLSVSVAFIAIAGAIAIISDAAVNLSAIPSDKILGIGLAISGIAVALGAAIGIIAKSGIEKLSTSTSLALLSLAASLWIIADAIEKMAAIPTDQIGIPFAIITGAILELVAATKLIQQQGASTAAILIGMALALGVIAGAIVKLSQADPGGLAAGFGVLAGMLVLLAASTRLLAENTSGVMGAAAGMIMMSIALGIVANSIAKLAELDLASMGGAFLALTTILIGMTTAMILLSKNAAGAMEAGAGLLMVAVGIGIVANAFSQMAGLELGEVINGLIAMGGAITILCIALGQAQKNVAGAAALTVASVGLIAIASAIKMLDGTENAIASLIPLAAAIAALAVACNVMKTALPGAAALTVASVGILAIAGAFKLMEGLDMMTMLGQLLAVAAAIGIFAAAAMLLQPAIAPMLILTGTILVALVAAAAGISLVALSLGLLSVNLSSLAIVAPTAGEALGVLGKYLNMYNKDFLKAAGDFALLGPALLLFGAGAVVAGAGAIVLGAGLLIFSAGLLAVSASINSFLDTINTLEERLIEMGDKIPGILNAAVDNVITFIDSLATTIDEKTPELINAVKHLMESIKEAALKVLTGLKDDFLNAGKNAVTGFINGIKSMVGKVGDAAKSIGSTASSKLKSFLGIHSPSKLFEQYGKYTDLGFVNGLLTFKNKVSDASEKIGITAIDAMSNSLKDISDSVNEEADLNPVISPVIDLTGVKKSAGELDTMLTKSRVSDISASFETNRSMKNAQEDTNRETLLNQLTGLGDILNRRDSEEESNVNVTVVLDGDSGKIFNVVRTENDKFKKSTGKSALT